MVFIRSLIKKIYRLVFKPFFKNGIDIDIGGAGRYRFDYMFAFSRFEDFGSKHNAGFERWVEICKGKKTVFDVGAHIGLYSIPASRVLDKEGFVYAFEPSLANCAYLERHKRFNNIDNVKVFSCLVGDGPLDDVTFYENKDVDAMNSILAKRDPRLYRKALRKQVSLDDFCAAHKLNPEVLKIDVEGSELNVLKGAKSVFKNYRPVVFLSVHPRLLALLNQSADSVLREADGLGYDIYNAQGENTEPNRHNEYILIHKERKFHEIF